MSTRGRIAVLAGLLLVLGGAAQAFQKPGGTSRGKGRVSKPGKPGSSKPRHGTSRGGTRTGGLGRGIPNGVPGWPTSSGGLRQSSGSIRNGGRSTGQKRARTGVRTAFFHGFSSRRAQQSGSGLGAGIPKGGLGRGVSNGVPGWPTSGARAHYSHPIDHDRLFVKRGRRHQRGFLAAHYSLSSFAPEVESGHRAIYVEPRWVTTDRGKIRFMGGWASAAEGVESLEPLWVPASWYKTGDGSQIRVSGHFVFAENSTP